jgi:putative endonuclease
MEVDQEKSYVYILCNSRRNVVYVGCTDDLRKRIYCHKKRLIPGFTKRYNVDRLVYFEQHHDLETALYREKQIKKYRREKKNSLVQTLNAEWQDLYNTLTD